MLEFLQEVIPFVLLCIVLSLVFSNNPPKPQPTRRKPKQPHTFIHPKPELGSINYDGRVTKHIHADLMEEYARDAQEHEEPWLLWEYLPRRSPAWARAWVTLQKDPCWIENVYYRRKQESKNYDESK